MIIARLSTLLLRQYLRSVLLMTLLVVVPTLFITMSYFTTRQADIPVLVTEQGVRQSKNVWMPDLHGAIMVPIIVAFLSGVTGLFVMFDSTRADPRLVIAGVSARRVAAVRLSLILFFAVVVTVLSVSVTSVQSRPNDLFGFVVGNVLIAITYGFIGALVLLLVGRLGGAYLMLFVPMIDVGIFQDPMMISGEPPGWMKLWPGFGGTRFAIDAAFSARADDWVALLAGLLWTAALSVAALEVFTRRTSQ